MKLKLLALIGGLLTLTFTGCVRLPSVSQFPTNPISAPTQSATTLPTDVLPGNSAQPSKAKPAKAPSPTRVAIQHAVNWITVLTILGALAAVGFGAFLIYGGQVINGAKCVAGGVLLMIASIWFAYHWLLVVGLSLIGAGIYFAVKYWAEIAPLAAKIESVAASIATSVESKFVSKPATTAAPAATSATAAPAATSATAAPAATSATAAPAAATPSVTVSPTRTP